MLVLGIRYLNGFAAASEPDDRDQPEWPPHPARIFTALADAHFQTGKDPEERRVLEWLESLPAPSLGGAVTQYVPVQGRPGEAQKPLTAIIESIPQLARDRRPQTFARTWPEEDVVYLVWSNVEPDQTITGTLEQLCEKVSRIGHSMSLVQVWVATPQEAPEPTWVPDEERADIHLRVPWAGLLADPEQRYKDAALEAYTELLVVADEGNNKSRGTARKELKDKFGGEPHPRRRPQVAFYQGYARSIGPDATTEAPGTIFSPHLIVFRFGRQSSPYRALSLSTVGNVTARWREALISECCDASERVREIVSGHDRGGGPLEGPHLAFMPLAFVGHERADGHLLGMAIVLPRGLAEEERCEVLRVLGRVKELKLGRLGVWRVDREVGDRPSWNLRSEVWTAHPKGATHWSTVTPVAFDRHPKTKDRSDYQRQVAQMLADACVAIGLPRPREVIVTPVSAHMGVPPAHVFPLLARKDGSDRRHAHAIVVFDEPVVGPVLIGAGRYRGYGVGRPVEA